MSNGNLLEPISTATVAIFTPDMAQTLLVFNDRVGALVPPGGKQEPTDVNICHTGLRELWQEVGMDLPIVSGDWLDISGEIVDYQKIVQVYPFRIRQKNMIDHLFLFRMQGRIQEKYRAEKEGKWYSKKDLQPETIVSGGKTYKVLVP